MTIARSPSWMGLPILAFAVLSGVGASILGFLAAAVVATETPLLCLAGLILGFGVASVVGTWAGRLLFGTRRRAFGPLVAAGTVVLIGLASAVTVFRPMAPAEKIRPAVAPSDARFWDLPTGSRIAYRELRGVGDASSKPPVVFLHGGPGAGVVSTPVLAEALSFLTARGYTVYLYDQVGGGRSSRLADPRAYTVDRHVRDLEAIRGELGAETMILIGESWGGRLASHYIAAHPQRVDACVLVSPGPLPADTEAATDACDLKGRASAENRAAFDRMTRRALPRAATALALLEINPAAARAFLPDSEADAFLRGLFSLLVEKMVCDPARLPENADFDFGFWCNLKTTEDRDRRQRSLDDDLRRFDAPVLVLRGECDYCVPAVARHYRQVFPQATLVSLEGAGHIAWLDKPAEFADIVTAFLGRGVRGRGARAGTTLAGPATGP